MDKTINTHIDRLEELEAVAEKIIDANLKKIDIETLMSNPQAELDRIKILIEEEYMDTVAQDAIEEGLNFAEVIKKKIDEDKVLKIDENKDADLNA